MSLMPLKKLESWMEVKIKEGLGTYAQDGNGFYFLDFETLKYYSPFDDDLPDEDCRQFKYLDFQGSLLKGELVCSVDNGVCLEHWWVDDYESYLADKELLWE